VGNIFCSPLYPVKMYHIAAKARISSSLNQKTSCLRALVVGFSYPSHKKPASHIFQSPIFSPPYPLFPIPFHLLFVFFSIRVSKPVPVGDARSRLSFLFFRLLFVSPFVPRNDYRTRREHPPAKGCLAPYQPDASAARLINLSSCWAIIQGSRINYPFPLSPFPLCVTSCPPVPRCSPAGLW
jgi:hypothetical protein